MKASTKKTASSVKHPEVTVKDFGRDGNAFAIMGQVTSAMRRAKVAKEEIDAFRTEAMNGDYDNLLATCMKWVNT